MTTIAIMQPYFIPYAGYFRLISAADVFVIYDDVQFPKGGWVHRNRLHNLKGKPEWLTLPIKRQALHTKIQDMQFLSDAQQRWHATLQKFPAIADDKRALVDLCASDTPLDMIMRSMLLAAEMLNIPFQPLYSSRLGIGTNLHGQDRVIEMVRQLGGTHYLNAPGGRDLYDQKAFAEQGITLSFLPDYEGSKLSILQRLIDEEPQNIHAEITQKMITTEHS